MDQAELVSHGQSLVKLLDEAQQAPRLAMWVKKPEHDIWRLWMVPKDKSISEQEFYLAVVNAISTNRKDFHNFEASEVEYVPDDHPALEGIKRMIRVEGISAATVTNNTFNGVSLPDGIIIRQSL